MVKTQLPKNITFNLGSGITPPSSPREELTGRERYELHLKQQEEECKLKDLPQFGSTTLKIPPFFAVPTKKGWRLANPLTEIRNLAQRQHKLSIRVKRANVKTPELDLSIPRTAPKLDDFPPKDRAKLKEYYKAVNEGKVDKYLTKNKPRGFPATLYKNAERAGYKETTEKVYTKNEKKVKVPSSGRPAKQRKQIVIHNDDNNDIISTLSNMSIYK